MALLAAGWPAVVVFGRLGITTRDGPMGPHLYELAFISIILGVTLGVSLLARSSWFLERTDPARRIAAESGALVGATLGPLIAAFAPALFLAPSLADPLDPRRLGAIALTLAHVIAIGLVALRVPASPALRPLLVPLGAWLIPGLVGRGSGIQDTIYNLLAASGHGRPHAGNMTGMAQQAKALLPIGALVLAAWQLAASRPSVHALRNPR